MKPISFAIDLRGFVVGVANYTLDRMYWSWCAYFGVVYVQIHILKPRWLRRRIRSANRPGAEAPKDV